MSKSVFEHLFEPEEASDLEDRAVLLMALQDWLKRTGLSHAEVAEKLGMQTTRVSEIESGKIDRFDFDTLVTLATRAGMDPSGRFATFTEWDSEADRKAYD